MNRFFRSVFSLGVAVACIAPAVAQSQMDLSIHRVSLVPAPGGQYALAVDVLVQADQRVFPLEADTYVNGVFLGRSSDVALIPTQCNTQGCAGGCELFYQGTMFGPGGCIARCQCLIQVRIPMNYYVPAFSFVQVYLDPQNLVAEENENNNVFEGVVPPPCSGDINGDGVVDLSDLAALLAHFGTAGGASSSQGDLNGDGAVDLSDLALLLANFGRTC